jgi:hypothetical protein
VDQQCFATIEEKDTNVVIAVKEFYASTVIMLLNVEIVSLKNALTEVC